MSRRRTRAVHITKKQRVEATLLYSGGPVETGGYLQLTLAPAASVIGPITVVLGTGWLSTTNTLVSVTLPVLLTVPMITRVPPGATGTTGQTLVTAIPGQQVVLLVGF